MVAISLFYPLQEYHLNKCSIFFKGESYIHNFRNIKEVAYVFPTTSQAELASTGIIFLLCLVKISHLA
jgi:hypothetical protein